MKQKRKLLVMFMVCSLGSLNAEAGFFDGLKMLVGGSTTFVEPANSQELVRSSEIVTVAGPNASSTALLSLVEQQLQTVRINDANFFTQIRRSTSSQNLGSPNAVALEVSVNQGDVAEQQGQEMRTQCLNGKVVCKDSEARHYSVQCMSRTARVSASLGIKNNGQAILASRTASTDQVSKVCSDTGGALEDGTSLLSKAYGKIAQQLLADFVPVVKKRPIELLEEDSGADDSVNNKLKQAYRIAKDGSISGATRIYEDLASKADVSGVVLFNAAYCQHAIGNFAKAHELYAKAASAPRAPNDLITKYQTEASDWIARGVTSAVVK